MFISIRKKKKDIEILHLEFLSGNLIQKLKTIMDLQK